VNPNWVQCSKVATDFYLFLLLWQPFNGHKY